MKDESPKDDDSEKTGSSNSSSVKITNAKTDSVPNAEVSGAISSVDDSDRTSGREADIERIPVAGAIDPTTISAADAGNTVSQQPLPNAEVAIDLTDTEARAANKDETVQRRSESEAKNASTVGSEPEPIPIDDTSANTANLKPEGRKPGLFNWLNKPFSSSKDKKWINWTDECCDEKDKDKAKWFWSIGYNIDDENIPCGIAYKAKPNKESTLTDEAKKLLEDVETASVRISVAFRKYPSERKRMFRSLKETAVIGLFGNKPDPALARVYFNSFKNMVPTAAEEVRKEFFMKTVWWSLLASLIAFALLLAHLPMHTVFMDLATAASPPTAASECSKKDSLQEQNAKNDPYCESYPVIWAVKVVNYFYPNLKNDSTVKKSSDAKSILKYSTLIMGYTLAIIGGSIGLMLIGFLRNREITYESFYKIYQYGMSPGRYLLLIMILALVIMILVVFDVFTVGVGSVTLNDVVKTPQIGLIIGLLSSMSEPLVSGMVVRQMNSTEAASKEK